MHIRLETNDGGLVGHFDIPDFNVPPKIVTWGSRLFTFRRWDHPNADTVVVYGETFAYSIASIARPATEKDGT